MQESVQILFETERLTVRHYTNDDGNKFFLLNGDDEIMQFIRPVKSREESDLFLLEILQKQKENPGVGRWAVTKKNTGEFVGSFAFIPIEGTDKMQLGYALLKQSWGNRICYGADYGRLSICFYQNRAN